MGGPWWGSRKARRFGSTPVCHLVNVPAHPACLRGRLIIVTDWIMRSHFPDFSGDAGGAFGSSNLLDDAFDIALACSGEHAQSLRRLADLTRKLECSLHAGELRANLIPVIRSATRDAHGQATRSVLLIQELQDTVFLQTRWRALLSVALPENGCTPDCERS